MDQVTLRLVFTKMVGAAQMPLLELMRTAVPRLMDSPLSKVTFLDHQ